MKRINISIALTICLFCSIASGSAQVTVGSGEPPVTAGILDIKSHAPDRDNVTSSEGGVVMPRLKLVNIKTLEPFVPENESDIDIQKKLHMGLMVYNLTANTDFKEGLYVWNGKQWDAVVTETAATQPIIPKNGLGFSPSGDYIGLGGVLDVDPTTSITQNNNLMHFLTGAGSFSINNTDFVINKGNIGIGKTPSINNKIDVAGNMQINGDLTVNGKTFLKKTEIVAGLFTYNPNSKRKKGRYLRAIDDSGEASWQNIGGLSSPNMEAFPTNKVTFNPTTVGTTNYINTGLKVELAPGKWLVNYSVRIVAPAINKAKTGLIRPTTFRFTMLDEQGNPSPVTSKKPYDDNRAYPDVNYNSCTGFMIVENKTALDQVYSLGIKPQEIATWPNVDVEIANNSTKDAYIITLFLE